MSEPQNYIEITNFSPGIHTDFNAAGFGFPSSATAKGSIPINGAATPENTYDCYADRQGALVPWYKKTNAVSTANMLPVGAPRTAAYYPGSAGIANWLLDANATTSGMPSSAGTPVMLYGYVFDPNGLNNGTRLYAQGVQGTSDGTNSVFLTKWTSGGGSGGRMPAGNIVNDRAMSTTYSLTTDGNWHVESCFVVDLPDGFTYAPYVTGVIPAPDSTFFPTVTAFWGNANNRFDENNYQIVGVIQKSTVIKHLGLIWTTGANTVDEASNGTPAGTVTWVGIQDTLLAVGHQGRLVCAANKLGSVGAGDRIYYSPIRQPTGFRPGAAFRDFFNPQVPGETPVAPVGAMSPVTADQLFLVKQMGGAVIISGDLTDPTIRNIPFAESTGGLIMHGVQTSLGFVYGSRNGIYLWAGGQETRCLSPQLDGFFWDHLRGGLFPIYTGSRGRFGWWSNCILVPNNFFMDTIGGGWWKISDTNSTPYNCYDVDRFGTLWAFPHKLTTTQLVRADSYTSGIMAASYSWQSQPLVETRGRYLSIQNVELLVSSGATAGTNTVTVTITGLGPDGTPITPVVVTITFGSTNQNIRICREDLPSFLAAYIQVRIEASTSIPATNEAPKIHGLKIGYNDQRGKLPRVG